MARPGVSFVAAHNIPAVQAKGDYRWRSQAHNGAKRDLRVGANAIALRKLTAARPYLTDKIGLRLPACRSTNFMPDSDERLNTGKTDNAGSSDSEDFHAQALLQFS